MGDRIEFHQYENGLVLLAEPMPWLESAAFTLLVRAGCQHDPSDRLGLANLTCEMVQRGCGSRTSRQFIEDLELLGVDTSASVSGAHCCFSGAMPAENVLKALALYADLVQRPHLPEEQFEDGRQACLQEVWAFEDDPAQRVMSELRRLRYADPYGRTACGTEESLERITLEDTRTFWQQHFAPEGAILAVAGKLDWPRLKDEIANAFGSWATVADIRLTEKPPPGGYQHLDHRSAQTHIGIAYPSVPYSDDDFFQARGAVGILSDGMSSRLFTEVREKRGLCYSIHASCHSLKHEGSVVCYAGTTTDRAQETLDVLLEQLVTLSDGVHQDELDRLKARIKSILVMQQESSVARSGAIAGDWYFLERVRTLSEIERRVDALTCESINRYLAAHPPKDFVVVTLGEKQLEVKIGIP